VALTLGLVQRKLRTGWDQLQGWLADGKPAEPTPPARPAVSLEPSSPD
jgi:hypothetical protein